MKKKHILYLGNFLNERVVSKRQLPTNNPAGSNRMYRIAKALSVHYKPIIISPGVSLNIKFNRQEINQKTIISHKENVVHFFSKTLAVPVLGLVYSYITYLLAVIRLINKTKTKQIVVYNFDPQLVIIVLLLKVFYPKIKIINNIEDISKPTLNDFKSTSEDRPLQQIVFYICMHIIAKIADGIIIPTKRFKDFLPGKKHTLIVTGCIDVKQKPFSENLDKLIVLFSGKIAFEHGIDVFIEALIKLSKQTKLKDKIKFYVTGGGQKSEWLKNRIKELNLIDITYFGFVSSVKYTELLNQADVCVALQKETGRHSNYKTPSKVYEYLGNSKIVITTDVGDLKSLGDDIITICAPLTSDNLISCFSKSIDERSKIVDKRLKVGQFALNHFDTLPVGIRIHDLLNDIQNK
ncbi:glycosyltransferase [Lacinutrix gracilariae]|uniref:Glycosyltransferase n=1 Tax=Lacinutrix gracilariae TaxID=1747198 RepID=A0ABW5K2W6_9FLAO